VSRQRRGDGREVRQHGKGGKRRREWHEGAGAARRNDEAELPVTPEAALVDPASGEPTRLTEGQLRHSRTVVV
jgi:hypothetical protein